MPGSIQADHRRQPEEPDPDLNRSGVRGRFSRAKRKRVKTFDDLTLDRCRRFLMLGKLADTLDYLKDK